MQQRHGLRSRAAGRLFVVPDVGCRRSSETAALRMRRDSDRTAARTEDGRAAVRRTVRRARGCCVCGETGVRFLASPEASGDAEQPCALERVGEDLQTADLVAAIAPDVHDGHPLGPLALRQVGVTEHDDGVALLDELVGAELELVPRPNRLLEDPDGRLLSLMAPRAGKFRRVRALPYEVVAPQIERPLEIALVEALVTLSQRVRLAGHATLLSSAAAQTARP